MTDWRALARKYVPWLGLVLVWALTVVAARYLGLPVPPPPEPPEQCLPSQGWVEDPASVQAVMRGLATPLFADTPAGKAALGPAGDADVFLWKAQVKATGALLPARNQGQVGSCVSFGTATAVETLECVQIAGWDRTHGPPPSYRDLAQEVIYGGSRVQVGGGRLRGDGSVGAWAAKWVKDYGVVARGVYGANDLSQYSEATCRQYGDRGCPKELEPVAKEHPVKAVSLVRTGDEAKNALAQGYPLAVCSGQGFSAQRDADGFCRAQGSWAHCMAILGYQGGARPGFFICNSWGTSYHKGPGGKGDPPPAGFWAEASVVERMLGQGDTWAFSDVVGFPAKKPVNELDWYVRGRQRRPADAEPVFALAP